MKRKLFAGLLPLGLLLSVAACPSCKTAAPGRPYREPPPPDLKRTTIDYAETDAFDALFESALTNQDPAIVIQTTFEKPDWGPRLNAWIAAWNRGGTVGAPQRTARMQAPLLGAVPVDGDSIREFRLLIESLMDRVENLADKESAWWTEERTRTRRVALLKPYNLRFHQDEQKHIQLIFFNGNYSQYYPEFLLSVIVPDAQETVQWSRTFECSRCKRRRDPKGPAPGRLTGRGDGQ
jgi:hypothetical protein